MTDESRGRLIILAVIALGATLTGAKPTIVDALARHHAVSEKSSAVTLTSADSPAAPASTDALAANAAQATPATKAIERRHTFRVIYKRGYSEWVRGDTLTIENGSYVIRDNSSGLARTVGVFPMASVDSVVAVSAEVSEAEVLGN